MDLLNENRLEYDKRSNAFRLKRNNSFRLKRNNSFRLKKRNNSFRLRKKKDDEEEEAEAMPAMSTRNTSYRLRRNNSFRLRKRMLPGFYFNLFRHPQEEGEPGEMRGIEGGGGRHLMDRRSNAFRL